MIRGSLERLRAELHADRAAWTLRLAELRELDLDSADPAVLAQAAVALHHGYGAIESALSRVARFLEGSLPEGPDWHQALIESMALELEGVRPALLSTPTVIDLRKLLSFRHFFRHAYAVPLDAVRLKELRAIGLDLAPRLSTELDAVDDLLRRLVDPGTG